MLIHCPNCAHKFKTSVRDESSRIILINTVRKEINDLTNSGIFIIEAENLNNLVSAASNEKYSSCAIGRVLKESMGVSSSLKKIKGKVKRVYKLPIDE